MANYANLKSAIQQVVKTNGNNEITGSLLQQSLLAMIDSLGGNYSYSGIATPTTNPGTPDQNVFYIAAEPGAYSNFGGASLSVGEVAILKYNGSWHKDTTKIASLSGVAQLEQNIDLQLQGGGIFDKTFVFSGGSNYQTIPLRLSAGKYKYTTFTGASGVLQDGSGNTIVALNENQTERRFTITDTQASAIEKIVFIGGNIRIASVNEQIENLDAKIDNEIFNLQSEIDNKFGYEKNYAWVTGTYTKYQIRFSPGTIRVSTNNTANTIYFENSSGQAIITINGYLYRELTLTQEQADAITNISIYGGDFQIAADGLDKEIEQIKEKVDDSIFLRTTGNYSYKRIEYDFKAFGFYKVTVESTSASKVDFQGLVNASDDSGDYLFSLKSGESILLTPTKTYQALYVGAAGSYIVNVEIYGPSTINTIHTFYCGPTRQYTKITDAIKAATLYMNSVLFVDAGEYDIINELGADYFNMTESNYSAGPILKNGIKVIATPGAKIVCHYTGSNETVMRVFSPLNAGPYGFTLSGVHIEASRVRYAVHDELNSSKIPTKCRYENCFMSLDNSNNPVWGNASCIGGGLAAHAVVDVLNSIFHPVSNGYKNGISYHEAVTAQDFDFKINVAGNYLIDGAIIFQMSNQMQGKNNYITVHDNNVPNDSRLPSGSAVVKDGGAFTTNIVLEWNNTVRV